MTFGEERETHAFRTNGWVAPPGGRTAAGRDAARGRLSLIHIWYAEAFKAGAVQMVTEQGREPKEVAKDLGICIDTLRSWMKTAGMQMGQVSRANREQQRIRDLEAEIRAMRKQLSEKDEVIDILKKSVGILSKP